MKGEGRRCARLTHHAECRCISRLRGPGFQRKPCADSPEHGGGRVRPPALVGRCEAMPRRPQPSAPTPPRACVRRGADWPERSSTQTGEPPGDGSAPKRPTAAAAAMPAPSVNTCTGRGSVTRARHCRAPRDTPSPRRRQQCGGGAIEPLMIDAGQAAKHSRQRSGATSRTWHRLGETPRVFGLSASLDPPTHTRTARAIAPGRLSIEAR